MATITVDALTAQANEIRDGKHASIRPGEAVALSPALTVNDGGRQGDVYVKLIDAWPEDYVEPTAQQLAESQLDKGQLVYGQNIGSRHCLKSTENIEIRVPKGWNAESLLGPAIRFLAPNEIGHPTHGAVQAVAAGSMIQIGYQKLWEKIQKQERRNRD